MKKQGVKHTENIRAFIKNDNAVIGLPMRLTVSIIIGIAALVTIMAFILNPCLFPSKMAVSINPMVNTITTGDSETFFLSVNVTDDEGFPISGANVMIKGLGGAGSNNTDIHGRTTIETTAWLQSGQNEGYLDITVKCGCFETFSQTSMIKVVRG